MHLRNITTDPPRPSTPPFSNSNPPVSVLPTFDYNPHESDSSIYVNPRYIPDIPTIQENQLTPEGKEHRNNKVLEIKRNAQTHQNQRYQFPISRTEGNISREILQPSGIIIEGPRGSDAIKQAILPSGSVLKFYDVGSRETNSIKEIFCSNGQILKPDFTNIPSLQTIQSPLASNQINCLL
ncbi:MAG: hypothetical protein ACQBVK_02845 [Candidatus Phytoplasma sp. TWB_XP]